MVQKRPAEKGLLKITFPLLKKYAWTASLQFLKSSLQHIGIHIVYYIHKKIAH